MLQSKQLAHVTVHCIALLCNPLLGFAFSLLHNPRCDSLALLCFCTALLGIALLCITLLCIVLHCFALKQTKGNQTTSRNPGSGDARRGTQSPGARAEEPGLRGRALRNPGSGLFWTKCWHKPPIPLHRIS